MKLMLVGAFCFLAATVAFAEDESMLNKVCEKIIHGVEKVCSEKVSYPKIDVKKCNKCTDLPTSCKTKKKVWYPCGVSCHHWKCKKKECTKEVCVPGFEKRCIDIPCGFKWEKDEISICKDFDTKLIDTMGKMCGCLDGLIKAVTATVQAVGEGKLDEAASKLITALVSIQKCIDQVVPRISNAAEVTAALQKEDSATIQMKPIDLIFYEDLLVRVVACFTTGECQTIFQRFVDYIKEQKPLLINGLKAYGEETAKRLLKPVTDAVAYATRVEENIEDLFTNLPTVIANCTLGGEAVQKQLTAFAESLKPVKQLMGEVKKGEKTVDDLKNIYKSLDDAVPDSLKGLFNKDKLKELKDIFNKIPDALQQAPTSASAGKALKDLSAAVKNIDKTLKEGVQGINIDNIMDHLEKDTGKCLEATGITKVNEIVNILKEAEKVITAEFKAMLDKLAAVNGLSVKVDTKAYKTWYDIKDLTWPCLKKDKVCDDHLGCLDYPKFYKCKITKKVQMPNEHLVFLRLEYLI